MKKIFNFAMMGAIALTGAMTFTACSSDEEMAEVNPTFDGESVKTDFSISVGDVKGATRMSNASVQAEDEELNPLFQGMTDIYLFPATAEITGAETDVAAEGYINLPDFTRFDAEQAGATGKYYKDVTFSVGVKHFLFYAAINAASKDNGELKPSYLKMDEVGTPTFTPNWAATPLTKTTKFNSITFDLVPFQKGKTIAQLKADEKAIATLAPLKAIDAKLAEEISAAHTAEKTLMEADLKALQKTLRNDKSVVTTGNPTPAPQYTEYAASSASILYLMTKVYNALKNLEPSLTWTNDKGNADTSDDEIVDYAKAMLNILADATDPAPYFTATQVDPNDDSKGWTLAWKEDPNFPANLGLPDGAVAVKYQSDGANTPTYAFDFFEITTTTTPNPVGLIATSMGSYVHPARLYYFANTPAKTKDENYLSQGGNNGKNWETILTEGSYTNNPISATTRSVVMQNEVQYAVARLDVSARIKPGVNIYDSGSGIEGDIYKNPQPVTVPATGYDLTGVFIGGQKQVDWKFEPVTNATEYTIYDKNMSRTIKAVQDATYSGVNHTLALETAKDAKVRIALEFVNTGNAFYGINNNVIPAGSKFYLIAELDPTDNGHGDTAGRTATDNKVFKQDFTTKAQLTIAENSLAKAYNVIPDLRSPKLEFGLSVNLEWRQGITFEQEF